MSQISEILLALSEPFSTDEVEFKPGAINNQRDKALALAYVDSRAYIHRLNTVCPEWQDDYQFIVLPDRVSVICRLTINQITRTGDGECLFGNGEIKDTNAVTTASAQAFKRACVKFGLGAYLYALPQVWCDYDQAKKRIVNPPQLPDWAKPQSERRKPVTQPMSVTLPNPNSYIFPAGKYAGEKVAEVFEKDPHYVERLCSPSFQPKTDDAAKTKSIAQAFMSSLLG